MIRDILPYRKYTFSGVIRKVKTWRELQMISGIIWVATAVAVEGIVPLKLRAEVAMR